MLQQIKILCGDIITLLVNEQFISQQAVNVEYCLRVLCQFIQFNVMQVTFKPV